MEEIIFKTIRTADMQRNVNVEFNRISQTMLAQVAWLVHALWKMQNQETIILKNNKLYLCIWADVF